jgi:hypothetical protein
MNLYLIIWRSRKYYVLARNSMDAVAAWQLQLSQTIWEDEGRHYTSEPEKVYLLNGTFYDARDTQESAPDAREAFPTLGAWLDRDYGAM